MRIEIAESARRRSGAALIVAAVLSVALMSHHPTSVAAHGSLGVFVHGGMLLLLFVLLTGFTVFAAVRGLGRLAVLAGLVAYTISTFANIGAATINGLVVPALAARDGAEPGHDVFLLAWESNQALALLAVVAIGIAFLCWSVDLLGERRGGARLLGAAGVAAGVLPAGALLAGGYGMNVQVAFVVYAVHAAWTAAAGAWLLRVADSGPAP